ncbi:MAG: 50S ribosomal protein L23 [Thermodesulfobacteriota bacterium]|nr:50S ribosomal protein L23 [Thermodesulfobacteriota bacterium]
MKEYDIIRRPVNTEKTTMQKEYYNQICFEVARDANRVEIKEAVEKIFNTRVSSVRTMHVKGKTKMRGKIVGRKRSWKKAIVKLSPGQKIDFFEGV